MTNPIAPTGDEANIRAIVFREGDLYVAQCIDYDIAVQAPDLPAVLDRLQLTVEAESAHCSRAGKRMCDCIPTAPNYYHGLWNQKSSSWTQHDVAAPLEIAFLNVA